MADTALAERLSARLPSGENRRSFLKKVAVVTGAVLADPAGLLLKPALAHHQNCTGYGKPCGGNFNCSKPDGSSCSSFTHHYNNNYRGGCFDGWTAFCCQLENGSNSACPPGTFVAGWWHAATASAFCGGNDRYIIDCNSTCHSGASCDCTGQTTFRNGKWCGDASCTYGCIDQNCKCVDGQCNKRRTACNWFRYGNCNQDRDCSGPVVCRLSRCTKPYNEFDCTTTTELSSTTACHTANCLNDEC